MPWWFSDTSIMATTMKAAISLHNMSVERRIDDYESEIESKELTAV